MSLRTRFFRSIHYGYQLFFNDICKICYQANKSHDDVCHECYQKLPWLKLGCRLCAAPILLENIICPSCLECLGQPIFGYDRVSALFRYEAPIKQYLHQLKYFQKLWVARFFAKALVTRMQAARTIDAILPVPLAKGRLKERGYNQSLEIAKLLSAQLNVPCYSRAFVKIRETKRQSELKKHQRLINLTPHDFQLIEPIPGKNVLLIDDVFTTGRTLRCAAMALKSQGIQHIEAWAVCRSF